MADVISWEAAIGKKVRSADDKDLGKIQTITKDYIQTKDGTVSKDYYFIPKYYIIGYDGDHIWISITKTEVKSRFEREKVPSISEWETPDYLERRAVVTKEYPDFATNIPVYAHSAVPSAATNETLSRGVPLSWDKIIGKKVKSSDDKDLGEVEAVAPQFVEIEDGTVNKKRYYIPKMFVEGFDGHKLFTSLTKDEIKDRYERDSPPSPSEIQSPQFYGVSTVDQIPQTIHGVPWMAKEPDTSIPVDYSGTTYNIPWDQLIHRHVRTTDNVEIGYVERIGNEFVVVREGVADVHIYYVPKTYIKEYDGSQLWIDVPSGLVRAKFEMDREPAAEELRAMARQAPRYKRRDAETFDSIAAETQSQRTSAESNSVIVEDKVDLDKIDEPSRT